VVERFLEFTFLIFYFVHLFIKV